MEQPGKAGCEPDLPSGISTAAHWPQQLQLTHTVHICRSLHQHLLRASSGGTSTALAQRTTPIACLEDMMPMGRWTLML